MQGDKLVLEFPADLAEHLINEIPARLYEKATDVYLRNRAGTMTCYVRNRSAEHRTVSMTQFLEVVRERL